MNKVHILLSYILSFSSAVMLRRTTDDFQREMLALLICYIWCSFDEVFNRQFSTGDVCSSSLLHRTQFDEVSEYQVKIKLPLHFLQLPWLNVDASILTAPNLPNQVLTKCVSGREGEGGKGGGRVFSPYIFINIF